MKLSAVILFIVVYANATAQYVYPDSDKAVNALSTTLVVQLLEGEHGVAKTRNTAIKEVFTKHWHTSELLFLTQTGIDSLAAIHKNGFSYIFQKDAEYQDMRSRSRNSDGSSGAFGDGMGAREHYAAFSFEYSGCYLNTRIDGDYEFVTNIGFANNVFKKTDYLFLCQQMHRLLSASAEKKTTKEYFNVKRNLKDLATKTLLLPTSIFKEKDLEKIGKYYPHPYELMEEEVYEQHILNQEKGKAYVKIIWSFQHKLYMWLVINAEDGAILAITGMGGVHVNPDQTARGTIKAKHFKYVTSKFAQNFNNRYGWKIL